MFQPAILQTSDNSSLHTGIPPPITPYMLPHTVNMWLLFRWRNNGILAFLKTHSMVFANLTYLDSLNRYIVLCSYKALMDLCERRVVSTEPCICIITNFAAKIQRSYSSTFLENFTHSYSNIVSGVSRDLHDIKTFLIRYQENIKTYSYDST